MALFLPLAAWLIASRRGEWNQLLAATLITVADRDPGPVVAARSRSTSGPTSSRRCRRSRPPYTRLLWLAREPTQRGYIRLVHWDEEEAPERAARLERLGYEVEATSRAPRSGFAS